MKAACLVSAFLLLGLTSLMPSAALAQPGGTDEFQRTFTFHNHLPIKIFPVIQAPQNIGDKGERVNCGFANEFTPPRGLLRIIVNDGTRGAGIAPGGSATVNIPKTTPCKSNGQFIPGPFYTAARILIFVGKTATTTRFIEDLDLLLLGAGQNRVANTEITDVTFNPPLCPGCWFSYANADYGNDFPGQLLEYTIISQSQAGEAFPDPNDPRGKSQIDFDISYVDDVYLPVTMIVGDGATQYMGSDLSFTQFNEQLTKFLASAKWSRFASYAPENFDASSPQRRSLFHDLINRTDKLPSGNLLAVGVTVGGGSFYYHPSNNGGRDVRCKPANDEATNRMCPVVDGLPAANDPPDRPCCPDGNGNVAGCCDNKNFLIEGTLSRFVGTKTEFKFNYTNQTLDALAPVWNRWIGTAQSCTPAEVARAPVREADKAAFCSAFRKTFDFVWKSFLGFDKVCSQQRSNAAQKQCLTASVIGYAIPPDDAIKKCRCPAPDDNPNACPFDPCLKEGVLNQSVQALMRGLPWTPAGPAALCTKCPSQVEGECPVECIFPKVPDPDAKLWHRDGFLHFWAVDDPAYTLNPYTAFVHGFHNKDPQNPNFGKPGLSAPGAYSFSIDDFYGNFGTKGSTLIINVGSIQGLPNQEPYDPYKQYTVGFGEGWNHATVCGRRETPAEAGKPFNVPVSFWRNGVQSPECEIRVHATADEGIYLSFLLKEQNYTVKDRFVTDPNKEFPVAGLKGVFANRFGDPTPDDEHCIQNSTDRTRAVRNAGFCTANLVAGSQEKDYVGVSNEPCRGVKPPPNEDPRYWTCGKPLVNLNIPSNH
jgi:hypothetical protein